MQFLGRQWRQKDGKACSPNDLSVTEGRAAGPIRLELRGPCPELPQTPGRETHNSVNPSGVSAVKGEDRVSKQ